MSPSLSLSLPSLFICSCFLKRAEQFSFSFFGFSAALCPRDFLFLSRVRRDLSLSTSLWASHVPKHLWRFVLCPPLLPAGCYHLAFVDPYHSLLFHLSCFSVVASFRTTVVFLTMDRLPLLGDEHEDGRDTLCIVSECWQSFITTFIVFKIIIRG